jgi:hypothetical protein
MVDYVALASIIISVVSALGGLATAIHFKLNSNCCSCCSCEAYERSRSSSRINSLKKHETKETAIEVQPNQSLA